MSNEFAEQTTKKWPFHFFSSPTTNPITRNTINQIAIEEEQQQESATKPHKEEQQKEQEQNDDENEEEAAEKEMVQRWKLNLLDGANILKSFLGSNFIGVPYAFSVAGTLTGFVGTCLLAFISWHCCCLLLSVKSQIEILQIEKAKQIHHHHHHHQVEKNHANESINHDDDDDGDDGDDDDDESDEEEKQQLLARMERKKEGGITFGGVAQQVFGKGGLYVTNFFLIFTQLGFCIGYLIFISSNLLAMLNIDPSSHLYDWRHFLAILTPAIAVFLLTLIMSVRALGYVSQVSTLLLAFAIIGIVASAFRFESAAQTQLFQWRGLPIFVGLITGAFEGIGAVIPVRDSMSRGSPYARRYQQLFGPVMSLVALVLACFGLCGYLSFGSATNAVITLNLPAHSAFAKVIQAAIICSVAGTFPLQMVPVTDILTPVAGFSAPWQAVLLRALLCLLVALVAYAIPFFGLISALIGAVGSSFLSFIFPAAASLKLGLYSQPYLLVFKNAALLAFGLLIIVIGGMSAIKNIIDALHS